LCYKEVKDLLNTYRVKLEHLKDILIEEEIVDGRIVYEMVASCDLKSCIKNKDDTIQAYIDAYDNFDHYRDGDDIILP